MARSLRLDSNPFLKFLSPLLEILAVRFFFGRFALVAFIFRASSTSAVLDTLALVNGESITSDAFKYRFELSVYPDKDNPTYLDSIKKQFLLSMVAEKLLSIAALESGDLLDAEDKSIRKEAEEIFLRDALYRQEVVNRAKITNEEIQNDLKNMSYFYVVDAFYFPDSTSASWFYLQNHALPSDKFYSVAVASGIRHDTLQIGYGESNEQIEHAFFGLEPHFVSKPTYTEDGFVLFRVIERNLNKKFASASVEERASWVRKILKSRKEEKLGFEYLRSLMRDVKVEVNYELFRPLVLTLQDLIKSHKPSSIDPHYHVTNEEIISLRKKFSNRLTDPLLKFAGGSVTLEQVFEEFPLAGFTAEDTAVGSVTSGLHAALKFITQNYFLSKHARKLGLQNLPEVKSNVQTILDAFRAARMTRLITDRVTVSQTEVDSFFTLHRDELLRDVSLHIQKFRANTINDAVDIFNRLNRNGNVRTAAGEAFDSSAGSNPFWIRAFELGEIGAVLADLKSGEIYGPVPEHRKYTIYKLLDKKSNVSDSALANSIQVAKDLLLEEKRRNVLNQYVGKLADENGVKIFLDKVRAVNVTPMQMYTVRYIGFGGKISAVPPVYPREGWIKFLQKKVNIFP